MIKTHENNYYALKFNVGENSKNYSCAKNNSGMKIIITKKLRKVVKTIIELLNTRNYNMHFEVSSDIDRYFIVL